MDAFNKNKYTLGIFKAFDTVDHNILLKKLDMYGIKGKNLKWFHSYLTNRKQFIKCRNQNTDLEVLRCGVPQSSIPGPLLFLIFVNDLKNSTKLLDTIMFADDTNFFYTNKNIKVLFETVNKGLHYVNEWFLANKLVCLLFRSLNAGKIKYLFFHKLSACDSIPLMLSTITFSSIEIKRESSVKFLGVIID